MIKKRISPEFLSRIKDKVNLIDVVGEHVVLKKSGANHVGLCPFHSERTPSFSVSEQKQLYHCYGCQKGGDLVSFVMEIHGLSFPEAIEELAGRAAIALPKDWSSSSSETDDPETARRRAAARDKLATAYKLNRFVAAFYHSHSQAQAQAQAQIHAAEYFKSRGVVGDLARSFYVGAAPASWDALAKYLVSKKAPLDLASELGLVKPSQNGPGYFDLFRNRAMFPIIDLRGKVVAFGGRALDTADSPKYLNSPESLLFQKSKVAFGLYQAQKHIREKNEVILVEGYFDVLGLHAAGFQNAVATCGTALTPDHLHLFRRLCDRVTILFDGDQAGIKATMRAMEVGLDQGTILYGAQMPEDQDPDEMVIDSRSGGLNLEGIEKMKALIGEARPILDAQIEAQASRVLEGPEAQTQALKQVASWLGRFKDPYGREIREESASTLLRVPRSLLSRAVQATQRGKFDSGSTPRPVAAPASHSTMSAKAKVTGRLSKGEKVILQALADSQRFAKILAETRSNLPPKATLAEFFEYQPAREWVAQVFSDEGEVFPSLAPEAASDPALDSQVRSTLTEALMNVSAGRAPVEEAPLRHVLGRAIGRAWARFSQQIKLALAGAEAKKDAGLQAQLMKDYLDVQRKMKEFSSFYDEA